MSKLSLDPMERYTDEHLEIDTIPQAWVDIIHRCVECLHRGTTEISNKHHVLGEIEEVVDNYMASIQNGSGWTSCAVQLHRELDMVFCVAQPYFDEVIIYDTDTIIEDCVFDVDEFTQEEKLLFCIAKLLLDALDVCLEIRAQYHAESAHVLYTNLNLRLKAYRSNI